MRKPVKALLALAAVLSASVAMADTAVWTNKVKSSTSEAWFTASNWTNENGVLEYAPAAGEDIVFEPIVSTIPSAGMGGTVADEKIWFGQTISTPAGNDKEYSTHAERLAVMTNATVGKVTGDFKRTIVIDSRTDYGQYGVKNIDKIAAPDGGKGRYIEFSDPNDFLGIWSPGGVYSRLIVNQKDTSKEAVIHNLTVNNVPVLSVASGNTAKVEVITGGGTVRKVGDGKASFGQADLDQTRIAIETGGEVELLGHEEDGLAKLFAKSAIHLDATKDLYETVKDEGGNTLVCKWKDAEGRDGLYAFAYTNRTAASHEAHVVPPRYLAEATANGMPLVDFSWKGKNPGAGHSAAILTLSQRFPNVRAVFYVSDCPLGPQNCFILGDIVTGSSTLQFHPGYGSLDLYAGDYSDPCVRHGDILLNGKPTAYNQCNYQLAALHTVAQNTLADAHVSLLCSREYYGNSSGGARLGEVLLFTNELTRAERVYISNYLNRKWGTAVDMNGGRDYYEVFATDGMPESPATISVPAGRVARIGKLRLKNYGSSYGLTKKGDGTLEVDEIHPSDAKITVQGGKVVFKASEIKDDAPVDGAYVWLDASNLGDSDVREEYGTNYVHRWNDCRGEAYADRYAITTWTDGLHKPRLVDSPITGTKVLDFGVKNGDQKVHDNTSACMNLSNWASGSNGPTYHYFAVMRMNSVQNQSVPIVSGCDMATYRDGASFFSDNYRTAASLGSSVTINGVAQDPRSTPSALYANSPSTTNQFYVVSVSAATPFCMNALCCQRTNCQRTCGGMEFAEVITYTRRLTPEEHRQNVAYLMRKWLGKNHPSQEETPRLTFDSDEDVTFASDADLALNEVKGGNGNVVKTGDGFVTVASLAKAPKNVTVTGGGLRIPTASSTFLNEAIFHFDASRLDTMDYIVADGVTNVTSWADATGNGVSAIADDDDLATQKPVLATVETAPGSGQYITAMDFGKYSWRTNDLYQANGSASMQIKKDGSVITKSIQEGILVFADAKKTVDTYDHRASLFCEVGKHVAQRDWVQGKLGIWQYEVAPGVYCSAIGAESSQFLNATAGTLDGAQTPGPHNIPSVGFHLYDYVNSNNGRNAVSGWGGFTVNAIARNDGSVKANADGWPYDYDLAWNDRGGLLVAEQICFSRILKASEANYLKAIVNAKWFGGEHPGYLATNVLDSVSVAEGATLLFTPNDVTISSVKRLVGDGTLSATAVHLTDELDVTLRNGKTSHLTVSGPVSFDGTLTVNVTADLTARKIQGGRYPILTASSFEGFDNTVFVVNVETPGSGIYAAKVIRDGNTIYLEVTNRGFLIMFK